tara:strand:+ start:7371 stop:8051 length:681 start_codon:yes stop_codon:yes gene_type:complete
MAVSRVGSWAAMSTGSEPSGTVTIGSGSNRMLVFLMFRERGTDWEATTFTIGGQSFSYYGNSYLDSTPDLFVRAWIWNESAIAGMSGNTISYADNTTGAKISWSSATFQDCEQVEPDISTGSVVGGQYIDLDAESAPASAELICGVVDKSANRDPFSFTGGLSERVAYDAADFANSIADNNSDGSTDPIRVSNDGYDSNMAAMLVILTAAADIKRSGQLASIGVGR